MRVNSRVGAPPGAAPTPSALPTVNVSGYLFVPVDDPEALAGRLGRELAACAVRGTVLVAPEGVNVALAGDEAAVARAREALARDARLAPLRLKESRSETPPFARLEVRVRPEIIAFDGAGRAGAPRAPAVSPDTLARWLDAGRDVLLLDARNGYEVATGTFEGALSLDIDRFRDFAGAVDAALADGRLDPSVPVVTFCTGGVRCEKAAPWLLERGFREVWQLDGGVLDWLAARGAERWTGDCFVFDDRVSVDAALAPTGAALCPACGAGVRPGAACACARTEPDDPSRPTP